MQGGVHGVTESDVLACWHSGCAGFGIMRAHGRDLGRGRGFRAGDPIARPAGERRQEARGGGPHDRPGEPGAGGPPQREAAVKGRGGKGVGVVVAPRAGRAGGRRDGGAHFRGGAGHACPAAQLVWRGYEWLQGLQSNPLHCDRESTGVQQRILERHRADHTMCVFVSLLAFLRAGENFEFFDRVQWGPVPQERLGAVFGMYHRACGAAVRVYTLSAEGGLEPQMTVGRGAEHVRSVLLVPSGDGGLHCLPLGAIREGARIAVPQVVLAELRGGPAPQVAAEPPLDAPRVGAIPALVEAGPPRYHVAVLPDPVAVAEREVELELEDSLPLKALVAAVSAAEGAAYLAASCATGAGLVADEYEMLPGPTQTPSVEVCYARGVSYRGIQAPPFYLSGVEWRGGWFPSQCPADPSLFTQVVKNAVLDVQFASATLDNFELFGTAPTYVPVRFEGGLSLAGRRTVTDGQMSVEFFTPGDSLHHAGGAWSVQEECGGVMRVVATNVSGGWRGVQPFSRFRRGVRVQAGVQPLGEEHRAKALWQLVCLESTAATETAILSRMRADEAQNAYKGVDAESAADLVRVLASRYRSAGNVAGPFSWGHCYSCGGELKGKMKQRICCPGHNSDLAKLVAQGCKVTSHASPIGYPGVVWTEARHPPLKRGVETVANGENFPMPRRNLRRCRPHHPAQARGWEEWGSTGQYHS